jgi:hypothetical protein
VLATVEQNIASFAVDLMPIVMEHHAPSHAQYNSSLPGAACWMLPKIAFCGHPLRQTIAGSPNTLGVAALP